MTVADEPEQVRAPRGAPAVLCRQVIERRHGERPEMRDLVQLLAAYLLDQYGGLHPFAKFAADLKKRYGDRYRVDHKRRIAQRKWEQFRCSSGPPWRTVEEVISICVPAATQERTFEDCWRLWTAARGRPARGGAIIPNPREGDFPSPTRPRSARDTYAQVLELRQRLEAVERTVRSIQRRLPRRPGRDR